MLFLARWARRLSWKETAEAFGTSWEKVFDAVEYVVTWGLEHRIPGQIDAIGVDEIQYAKVHKYLTLVYQIDIGITRPCAGSATRPSRTPSRSWITCSAGWATSSWGRSMPSPRRARPRTCGRPKWIRSKRCRFQR